MLKRSRYSVLPAVLYLLPAGFTGAARAQSAEVSVTAGIHAGSTSIGSRDLYFDWTPGALVSIKAGVVSPARFGAGGFWEMSRISVPAYINNVPATVAIANPQHFMGFEVYQKGRVGPKTYMRFGFLLGSVLAQNEGAISNTLGLGAGLDITAQVLVSKKVSVLINGGIRYFIDGYSSYSVTTVSLPLTIGVGYAFGNAQWIKGPPILRKG